MKTSDAKRNYQKQYRRDNKERISAYDKAQYKLIKEKKLEVQELYRISNPAKFAAKSSNYRASKLKATPPWVTKEMKAEMLSIYELAQELSWLSENGLEVDHILPLNGKEVKGLHVPWNLRIIPVSLNRSKNNRLTNL